jgi:hypothetical protein
VAQRGATLSDASPGISGEHPEPIGFRILSGVWRGSGAPMRRIIWGGVAATPVSGRSTRRDVDRAEDVKNAASCSLVRMGRTIPQPGPLPHRCHFGQQKSQISRYNGQRFDQQICRDSPNIRFFSSMLRRTHGYLVIEARLVATSWRLSSTTSAAEIGKVRQRIRREPSECLA